MRKNFLLFIFSSLLIFSGCSRKDSSVDNNLNNLPQNALNINERFYNLTVPLYENNKIILSIQLTNEGRNYIDTSLFKENYLISVYIVDVEEEKNIFSKENITWDLKEEPEKELILSLKDNESKIIEKYLDEQNGSEGISVSYKVDIFPNDDDSFVLRALGQLDRK